MNYYIENNKLRVTMSSKGAELISLWDKENGKEYIWNGDPSVWKWHAPVLFPCCGNFPDGYTHNGKNYQLPMHGFLRDAEHTLTDSGRFLFESSGNEFYPFSFSAETEFILDGMKLTHRLSIANRGNEPMPYSIGFHTGLRIAKPLLVFEKNEKELDGNEFKCNDETLKCTKLFTGIESRRITARGSDGKELRLTSPEFTTLVIWSAEGHTGDYVCIEPRIDTVPEGAEIPFARALMPSCRAVLEETIEIIS